MSSTSDSAARWTTFFQSYDWIIVNSSAGKDSQAMLDYVANIAALAGVSDRVVVAHADLGRAEWQGTSALARQQAEHYGFRFEVVKRPQGDLLDHAQSRGRWYSPKQRYCTSDHKRDQIQKIITSLSRETQTAVVDTAVMDALRWGKSRTAAKQAGREAKQAKQVRILNCLGMRAQEGGPKGRRAKMAAFELDTLASTQLRSDGTYSRRVDRWLPIHAWTANLSPKDTTPDGVWSRIKRSGVPYHPAYDLGMPRLSCVFCIFAPRAALLIAGKHNPELLDEYVRIEAEIGHTFKANMALAEIKAELEAGADVPTGNVAEAWNM